MGNFIMPETGLIVVGEATNLLVDGGLNLWDDATHLTYWGENVVGTSTVNREATEKVEGDYSCRLDIDADDNQAYIIKNSPTISLIPNKRYKTVIWYKNSIAGKSAKMILTDRGQNVFLKEDGTWQASYNHIILSNSIIWKKFEIDFYAHKDYSDYLLQLSSVSSASSSIYFDKVSIVECDEFVPKAIGTMNFDSGSVEPQVDETLRGATSGSLAKVVSVTKSGGTWGGGDAVGSISLTECERRFHDNENIDGMVGGANILTVNHPDTGVGVDLVKNGDFSVGNGSPNGWLAGNTATLTTEASGKFGNCLMITENGNINPYAYENFSVIPGEVYKFNVSIKAGTEATYAVSLQDLTNQGNIWSTGYTEETAGDWSTSHTATIKIPSGCTTLRIYLWQICAEAAGTTMYFDEVSLYEITPEEVVGDGKTLMVDSVVFVPTDADGDRLLLTDYDGNEFIHIRGKANRPNPIFFKKPRKLNGLKVAIMESGKAYIYLAQR